MLVLSVFPGLDLLGMAFELEGFCVVRGPEKMLGGDIRGWHVPETACFAGVIGGPPCQSFSRARFLQGRKLSESEGNLVPEFERIVREASPGFWVMENVPDAPLPAGASWNRELDAWDFGAHQHRTRRFSSNLQLVLTPAPIESRHPDPWPCVTASEHKVSSGSETRWTRGRAGRKVGRRMTKAEMLSAMGLPATWDAPALKVEAWYRMVGNGVPLPMGRAIARAVREELERRDRLTLRQKAEDCGRRPVPAQGS